MPSSLSPSYHERSPITNERSLESPPMTIEHATTLAASGSLNGHFFADDHGMDGRGNGEDWDYDSEGENQVELGEKKVVVHGRSRLRAEL